MRPSWPARARPSLASLVLVASLSACASPVRVEIARNGAPADALVTLAVHETDATCDELGSLAGAEPLYEEAQPGRAIGPLGDRTYLFVATGRDRSSCELRWRGCTQVRGRTRDVVRVVLSRVEPAERCPPDRACDGDGECVGTPAEDAGVDASSDEDGGIDAGADDDGGVDAGLDGSIADSGADAALDARAPDDGGTDWIEGCSDDFDRPELGPGWIIEPGAGSPRVELFDGALLVEPEAGGWYQAYSGLFVRRDLAIEGGVMLEAEVEATRRIGGDGWPMERFNTVGLLMRPTGQTSTWILVDFGMQQTQRGALGKRRIPDEPTTLSPVTTTAIRTARLRLCRVGDTVEAYVLTEDGSGWALVQSSRHAMLEAPLDVGVMATGWNGLGASPTTSITPDVRGLVRSVGCRRITSLAACSSP